MIKAWSDEAIREISSSPLENFFSSVLSDKPIEFKEILKKLRQSLQAEGDMFLQANTGGTFVLDVDNAQSRPGTKVHLWSYNGTVAQKWLLRLLR